MSNNFKRGQFQIHLSTAIILMFVALILTQLQFRVLNAGIMRKYGWPMVVITQLNIQEKNGWNWGFYGGNRYDLLGYPTNYPWKSYLLADIFTWLAILVSTGFVIEYLTRRREANQKQRPSWFQFHLSTCIVLMVVASGMLSANLQLRSNRWTAVPILGGYFGRDPHNSKNLNLDDLQVKGWPLIYYCWSERWRTIWWLPLGTELEKTLILNELISISVLVLGAFFCEWLIRRREARRP